MPGPYGPPRVLTDEERPRAPPSAKCLMCGMTFRLSVRHSYIGPLLDPPRYAHSACVLWSADVTSGDINKLEAGETCEGLEEVFRRATSTICSRCKEPGGVLNCKHESCDKTYHFDCAISAECFFSGNYGHILCKKHTEGHQNEEKLFLVERIVKHRIGARDKKVYYFVKWHGYPESDNTWEPAESFLDRTPILEYERVNREAKAQLEAADAPRKRGRPPLSADEKKERKRASLEGKRKSLSSSKSDSLPTKRKYTKTKKEEAASEGEAEKEEEEVEAQVVEEEKEKKPIETVEAPEEVKVRRPRGRPRGSKTKVKKQVPENPWEPRSGRRRVKTKFEDLPSGSTTDLDDGVKDEDKHGADVISRDKSKFVFKSLVWPDKKDGHVERRVYEPTFVAPIALEFPVFQLKLNAQYQVVVDHSLLSSSIDQEGKKHPDMLPLADILVEEDKSREVKTLPCNYNAIVESRSDVQFEGIWKGEVDPSGIQVMTLEGNFQPLTGPALLIRPRHVTTQDLKENIVTLPRLLDWIQSRDPAKTCLSQFVRVIVQEVDGPLPAASRANEPAPLESERGSESTKIDSNGVEVASRSRTSERLSHFFPRENRRRLEDLPLGTKLRHSYCVAQIYGLQKVIEYELLDRQDQSKTGSVMTFALAVRYAPEDRELYTVRLNRVSNKTPSASEYSQWLINP